MEKLFQEILNQNENTEDVRNKLPPELITIAS
jgi:hypothetical protein